MKDLKTPPGWRKGQTIFNFLSWLKTEKLFETEVLILRKDVKYADGSMADPFHISDKLFEEFYEEFLQKPKAKRKDLNPRN